MNFILSALLLALVILLRSKPKMTVPSTARAGDLTLEPCDYKTKKQPTAPSAGLSLSPSLASLLTRA